MDRFPLYREENETPKNSHTGVTPVVIGGTQDKNTNALIFLQDFCEVLNQMTAIVLAVPVKM